MVTQNNCLNDECSFEYPKQMFKLMDSLFLLMLYVRVNNFSVMLGQFSGLNQYSAADNVSCSDNTVAPPTASLELATLRSPV